MSEALARPLAMRAFGAMGTRFECVLGAFDRAVTATEASAVAEGFERLALDWHGRLTVFDAASTLSDVNAHAADRPVAVDPELFDLLARCRAYAGDTGGRFDVSVGGLMRARGFRPESAPRDACSWGFDAVELDPHGCVVRFVRPGVALDLGGIAKGFVLDLAAAELRGLGVRSALLHGGTSSVTAVGARPDGRPWRVALPGGPGAPVVELADASLSVSDASGRVVGGTGHVMDPSTGLGADAGRAACVFGASAEVCEVWSTALVVDPGLAPRLPDGYGCHLRLDGVWRPGVCVSMCCAS